MPHKRNLTATLITRNTALARIVEESLIHTYPGLEISCIDDNADVTNIKTELIIVDTATLGKAKLDLVLDQLPDMPVLIVVDGMNDVHNLSHLMQGRRELITQKGLEGLTLIQAVHHLLDRQKLHNQLQKTARHLKELSIRDDMTRLFNHRHFNDLLRQEVKKSNRYKRPLGLVIVALNDFTAINEAHGHHEGDRLLARAAGIIGATVRDVDITARYGDNEFSVILPETDEQASFTAGERIYKALSKLTATGGDAPMPVSISVGVAALGGEIKTKEELLKSGLRALIAAKRARKHHPIRSATEVNGHHTEVKENRHIIESLHDRISKIARRAERTYFHDLMKTISEFPLHRKHFTAHAERVAFLSERLAAKIQTSDEEIRQIRRAGLLHDIGKLAINLDIINKPAPLERNETKLVQQHPLFGAEIIGDSKLLKMEPDIIMHHHERFDGTGYPHGLEGDDISVGARIVAITEAWDTMINSQPYRTEPIPFDKALAELKSSAGTQFDPDLVDTFTSLITG